MHLDLLNLINMIYLGVPIKNDYYHNSLSASASTQAINRVVKAVL